MHILNGIIWGCAATTALASIRMGIKAAMVGEHDSPPSWWSMSFAAGVLTGIFVAVAFFQ